MTAAVEDHKQFNDLVAARLRDNISTPSSWKKSTVPDKQGFFSHRDGIVLLVEKIPCYAVSEVFINQATCLTTCNVFVVLICTYPA